MSPADAAIVEQLQGVVSARDAARVEAALTLLHGKRGEVADAFRVYLFQGVLRHADLHLQPRPAVRLTEEKADRLRGLRLAVRGELRRLGADESDAA